MGFAVKALKTVAQLGPILSVIAYQYGWLDLGLFINIITIFSIILLLWFAKENGKKIKRFFQRPLIHVKTVKGEDIIIDRRCKICNHERRREIEEKLLHGVKYEEIRDEYNVALGTINRHFRKHMPRLILDPDQLNQLYEEHRIKQIDLTEEMFKLLGRLRELYQKLERMDVKFEEGKRVSAHVFVESVSERRNILKEMREVLMTIQELQGDIKTEKDLSELLRKLKQLS